MRLPDGFGRTNAGRELDNRRAQNDVFLDNELDSLRNSLLDMVVGSFDSLEYDGENTALARAEDIVNAIMGDYSGMTDTPVPGAGGVLDRVPGRNQTGGGSLTFGKTLTNQGLDEDSYMINASDALDDERRRIGEFGTWLGSAVSNEIDAAAILDLLDAYSRGDYDSLDDFLAANRELPSGSGGDPDGSPTTDPDGPGNPNGPGGDGAPYDWNDLIFGGGSGPANNGPGPLGLPNGGATTRPVTPGVLNPQFRAPRPRDLLNNLIGGGN